MHFRLFCFAVMPIAVGNLLTFYRAHTAVNARLDYHLHYPKGAGIWSMDFFFVDVCVVIVRKRIIDIGAQNTMRFQWF